MSGLLRLRTIVAGCVTALAFTACGGDSGSSTGISADSSAVSPPPPPVATTDPNAPASTGNIAVDGRNWINYRRAQAGVPQVAENVQINVAALGHSEYQRTNNYVTHTQDPKKPGFTGADLLTRMNNAGYTIPVNGYAIGEVISATSSKSGAYMAEELITAIYHRFVIFEPMFKEIGTGAATTSSGYSYFTADFGSRGGFGRGIASGSIVTWPFNGQTQVTPNFFSDYETPDPVPDRNEVGYPISVHTNLDSKLTVQIFSVRPHGGGDLAVRLLAKAGDPETPDYAASIIPLSPLASGTTYDVSFSGTVNGAPVSRNWSFTTR
ncbi:CAP domain-containing protein [Massilia horti]|uniref:CAP domain-containing protein n=1 Tax=Massilia horti TaxID=2562153 RepID=A0A4Y9SWZ4_9BURK|nr:CAP domain-containing protein [Massilia horti]TFW31137.1 CAP domain-containing protein [Massilia horti]